MNIVCGRPYWMFTPLASARAGQRWAQVDPNDLGPRACLLVPASACLCPLMPASMGYFSKIPAPPVAKLELLPAKISADNVKSNKC